MITDPEAQLALERRYPSLVGRLARIPLTTLPTPVHPLAQLGQARSIARLWVKRDDRAGFLYGGNKPRKLEFVLGDAVRRGRQSVITFGGIGTHHGLATTICARQAGLRTILVLLPQPVTPHVRHCLLLDHAYGAELHFANSVPRIAAKTVMLLLRGLLRGDVPSIIPAGGTSVLGTLGYVNAALELAEQVRAGEMLEPDSIFVSLGSGGTVAGLLAGLKLTGMRSRVVGILVTDIMPPSARRLAALARSALRQLHHWSPDVSQPAITESDLTIVSGYLGACYGAPTPAAEEAQRLLQELEGIALETTYTAKCMAALLVLAQQPPYRDQTLLFWNTYSSVDPTAAAGPLPGFRDLPRAFHRFFDDKGPGGGQ